MATATSSRSSASMSRARSSHDPSGEIAVYDRKGGHTYRKGKMLGKGGFAKCYELVDTTTKQLFAGKIVEKKTLVKYRAKEKLTTEIKIHSSLCHPGVVGFHRFFEDSDNVYILLEVCDSQTMMELHKRRRTLTEPETRYYMKQTLEATLYMHSNKVIHRDLKLGNLFLDKDLKIKIGDFGLATTVEYDGERKKTLCGTPNYIAPEILDRKCGGHSYEVDIWSIGCILYTLLVGRPPFETNNIESTYRKIKTNDYRIPSSSNISQAAQDLIKWTLAAKPSDRPNVRQVMEHPFMQGFIPDSLPKSALTTAPSFDGKEAAFKPSLRRPLGTVDVNSPAATAGKGGAKVEKRATSSAPLRHMSAPSQPAAPLSKYKATSTPGEEQYSLSYVLDSLQKLIARQARATDARTPSPVSADVATSSIWISKWVDYSNKYGLGYQLSNGVVGVLFNDSTKMVLSANQAKIESIERTAQGSATTHLTLDSFPANLTKKVTLLKYFKSYMNEHLLNGGEDPLAEKKAAADMRPNMMHVKKWVRQQHAIVFRLSQGVVQINFFDHAKLIINTPRGFITFIDKSRQTNTYSISDISSTCTTDATVGDLIKRLPYAAEVVASMMPK